MATGQDNHVILPTSGPKCSHYSRNFHMIQPCSYHVGHIALEHLSGSVHDTWSHYELVMNTSLLEVALAAVPHTGAGVHRNYLEMLVTRYLRVLEIGC